MDGYKLYIRVGEAGTIVYGFSNAFETPQDGDILLTDNGPRHFHLYWPEPLTNDRGQYRYKWVDGQRIDRSQDELDAEWSARLPEPPTQLDLLSQQTAALMLAAANKDVQISQQQQLIAQLMMTVAQLQAGGAA